MVAEADKAADVLARVESFRPDLAFIQEEILAESNGSLISAVAAASSAVQGRRHGFLGIR